MTCSAETAEMCKLAENSFRDVNIAFANELSMIAILTILIRELIKLANRHPRVEILQPGAGVGGTVLRRPLFIVAGDPKNARIVKTARLVNDAKPEWIANKIKNQLELILAGRKEPKVACLGLAFKPDIDDLRESPAVQIAQMLLDSGIDTIAFEPNIEITTSLIYAPSKSLRFGFIGFVARHKEFLTPEHKNVG